MHRRQQIATKAAHCDDIIVKNNGALKNPEQVLHMIYATTRFS
jgi:hypothetical protein